MSTYKFHPMTSDKAKMISTWQYEEPFSIYNMEDSEECISELLNGEYYYAMNEQNLLVGYICIGDAARVPGGYPAGIYEDEFLDIGLGLKPEYTGRGKGLDFLAAALNFLNKRFNTNKYQLVVAEFNVRAINVYERIGFIKGARLNSKFEDKEICFVSMRFVI